MTNNACVITLLGILSLLITGAFAVVELPVRVTTWNAKPATKEVSLEVSNAAQAEFLYLRIHNIRFGGQVSIKINNEEWHHISNETVNLSDLDKSYEGIGGIHATIAMTYKIPANSIQSGGNIISIRLNGTDGVTTTIRVIEINLLDASGNKLINENQFRNEGSIPASDLPSIFYYPGETRFNAVLKGEELWKRKDSLINDPITKNSILASCSSCHFDDGSDLKYFNYSNESIIARSRFHGLTHREGQYIATYIRTRNAATPGRPWNPPFQPGANLDPKPTDSAQEKLRKVTDWMAGAGLDAVLENSEEALDSLLPNGTSYGEIAELMDHKAVLSFREVPTPFQMPDWNMWLPDVAPEDMWQADLLAVNVLENPTIINSLGVVDTNTPLIDVPSLLKEKLEAKIDTVAKRETLKLNGEFYKAFEDFNKDFFSRFFVNSSGGGLNRRSSNEWVDTEPQVMVYRNQGLDRARMASDIVRWMSVKSAGLVRKYALEDDMDSKEAYNEYDSKGVVTRVINGNRPRYTPEALSFPGGGILSTVFAIAPHIVTQNNSFFTGQLETHGKLESNQWYMLQTALYTGHSGVVIDNAPIDWAYTKNHISDAHEISGVNQAFLRAAFQVKMLQSQRTGRGIVHGGFDQRTTAPNFFFSTQKLDQNLYKGGLDIAESGLWKKLFEEYLYEWLYIVESYDLETMQRANDNPGRSRHMIEGEEYIPVAFTEELSLSKNSYDDNFFQLPNEVLSDSLYRMIPLLQKEGIDEALLRDLLTWCQKAWPYDAVTWNHTPNWGTLLEDNTLILENFEQATRFTGLDNTQFEVKSNLHVNIGDRIQVLDDPDLFLTNVEFPRNGGGRFIGVENMGGNGVDSIYLRDLNTPLEGSKNLEISYRAGVFKRNENAVFGNFDQKVIVRFDNGQTRETSSTRLNSDLFGEKFQTVVGSIVVPDGAEQIREIEVYRNRTDGVINAFLCIDNFVVSDATLDSSTEAPPTPHLALSTGKDRDHKDLYITLEFHMTNTIENPTSFEMPDNMVGYNVYRWEEGETSDNAKKINRIPVSPFYDYTDKTVRGGKKYYYQVTAVNDLNRESAKSNTEELELLNPYNPNVIQKVWYTFVEDALRIHWFATSNTDITHYEISRKKRDETTFQSIGITSASDGGLYFDDFNAEDGEQYEYYVTAINKSELESISSTITIAQEAPEIPTPALHYSAFADQSVVVNASGAVTRWENLANSAVLPAIPVSGSPTYPSLSLSSSGLTGIDMKEFRTGFELLNATEQDGYLDFRSVGTASTKTGFSVLVAVKADEIANAINPVFVNHGNPSATNAFGIRYNQVGVMQAFAGGQIMSKSSDERVSAGDTIVFAVNYDAASGFLEFWDSKNDSSLSMTIAAHANLSSDQTLFAGMSSNDSQIMNGMLGEIVFFDYKLSDDEFRVSREKLKTRWISKRFEAPARIEAEDFHVDLPGVDFNETSPTNQSGAYRDTAVDLEDNGDGGYNVSYTVAGEYLRYLIDIPESGDYEVELRVASDHNAEKRMLVTIDGASTVVTFNTMGAGWQTYIDVVSDTMALSSGPTEVKIEFLTPGINFDYFAVKGVNTVSPLLGWTEFMTYDKWLEDWDGHIGDPSQDRDNDGIPNIMEYALGTNPLEGDQDYGSLWDYYIQDGDVKFKFKMRKRDSQLRHGYETTTTLNGFDWISYDTDVSEVSTSSESLSSFNEIEYTLQRNEQKKFMRMKIEPYSR